MSPSAASTIAIVLQAVSETFPFRALVYSEVSSFFSTLITPDAVVAVDCAVITQARIENAPLTSLVESKIAPQFIATMFTSAHN
ncbi:MAG: hypothetical protein QOJ02_3176 [Acidobacteriota bacterium]|nr:hypothetical protein [Acidobacteriota bacterium]